MSSDDAALRKARDAAERTIAVCDVLAEIVHAGEAAFLADVRARWAAEMGLIRIGEAVARIPSPARERFADQPWRQIIDMRNFAAHQYDDLDPRRVWRTLTINVPTLRTYLTDTVLPALTTTGDSAES